MADRALEEKAILHGIRTREIWSGIAARGIGISLGATYGGSLLAGSSLSLTLPTGAAVKTYMFGANVFSKAWWIKAGINGSIETTNQLLTNNFQFNQLDVFDITAQGFLGLNTAKSAGVTAFVDVKPFTGNFSDLLSFNANRGAPIDFVTSYAAGRLSGVPGIQSSSIQTFVQFGADLSMKATSGGIKTAIAKE